MNEMSRSSFRNTCLLLSIGLILASILVFHQAQNQRTETDFAKAEIMGLRTELENAARLSAALDELDKVTISENQTTRLNILRHLGIEQNSYDFNLETRQSQQVGDINLYVRNVRIEATAPYADVMALADKLHNEKKMVLTGLNLTQSGDGPEDVRISIQGVLYGLEKQDQQDNSGG